MKHCTGCSFQSLEPGSKSDIYVSATVPYLISKVKNCLEDNEKQYKDIREALCIKDVYFMDIIELLYEDVTLSSTEKEEIKICPVTANEAIQPQHLFSARTLKAWHELRSSKDLISIIENNSITTYFQPIYYANKPRPFGFECLSRGISEDGRIIPPKDLFKKARLLSLEFALDRLTRETAIEKAASLGIKNNKLFINLLSEAIYNPQDCLPTTVYVASKSRVNPENLVFEIIESENIRDTGHLSDILNYCHEKGFKTSLDDFGSAYLSLKMLDELKPSFVKIDINIIRDLNEDWFKQPAVQEIVAIAKKNGILTIAKGIETQKEFDMARQIGVDLLQGYFLAKPSPNITEGLL